MFKVSAAIMGKIAGDYIATVSENGMPMEYHQLLWGPSQLPCNELHSLVPILSF